MDSIIREGIVSSKELIANNEISNLEGNKILIYFIYFIIKYIQR